MIFEAFAMLALFALVACGVAWLWREARRDVSASGASAMTMPRLTEDDIAAISRELKLN